MKKSNVVRSLVALTLMLNMTAKASDDLDPVDAVSSPPLNTEDPGVPCAGCTEMNVIFSGDMTHDVKVYQTPFMDFNVGAKLWNQNLEIQFQVPFVMNQTLEDSGSRTWVRGWGKQVAGVKWNFYNNEKKGVSVAVDPQFESNIPGNHSDERGVVDSGNHIIIPVLISKEWGPVAVIANVGYDHFVNPGAEVTSPDAITASLSFGRRVNDSFSVMGEVSRQTGTDFKSAQLALVNVGLMKRIGKNINVYASVGRSLGVTPDGRAHLYALTGIQILEKMPETPERLLMFGSVPNSDSSEQIQDLERTRSMKWLSPVFVK